MITVFTVCAIGAGTILVLTFLLSFIGMDGTDGDVDLDGVDAAEVSGVAGYSDLAHAADADTHHTSAFFGVLSFRSLVAATTFFGLGGRVAIEAGATVETATVIALASGFVAMLFVAWAMRMFIALRNDGTAHIERAVGRPGQVYLHIPPAECGTGKVTVAINNRTMEFEAITRDPEPIPTGAAVTIVGVVNSGTLEVTTLKA
jgi:hypothetical protein